MARHKHSAFGVLLALSFSCQIISGVDYERIDAATCDPGRTACNFQCVDLQTSAEHCGSCNNSCGPLVCANGRCTCRIGEVQCFGSCDNLQISSRNCGTCGRRCASDETCQSGVCTQTCPALCHGVCINTDSDPNNCGFCDVRCRPGESCVAARCRTQLDLDAGDAAADAEMPDAREGGGGGFGGGGEGGTLSLGR